MTRFFGIRPIDIVQRRIKWLNATSKSLAGKELDAVGILRPLNFCYAANKSDISVQHLIYAVSFRTSLCDNSGLY